MSDSKPLSLVRPSNFGRGVLCPGWANLAAVVPWPAESEAASEGTELHRCLPPDVSIDHLTPEQQRQVEKARAFILEKAGDGPNYEWPLGIETVHPELRGGTADVVHVEGLHRLHQEKNVFDRLVIVDLKFGRLPLAETFASWQLMIYGASQLMCADAVDVWIYQPRADAEDSRWHATVTAADDVPGKVNAVLERMADPKAPRVPSEEACKYCQALGWCPEAAAVSAGFAVATREPQGLSPIQLGQLGALAKRVEGQAKAVLAAVREILLAGGSVPGFTLETRRGSRHIPDAPAAYEALKDRLPLERFLALIELPLGELEEAWIEACWENGNETKVTKKSLREEFTKRLERVIARKPDTRVLTQKEQP